jgi:hypothetical protein
MRSALYFVAAAIIAAPVVSSSQSYSPPQKDSARDTTTVKKPSPPAPALDFSGIIFANFQYRGEAGPSKAFNKFDVERAYLTFRIPAGDRTSVRITTDVFQQTTSGNDNFYRGWVIRVKYAYLQYNFLNGAEWKANARVGILHTVFVDHEEQYWPRWISLVPTERAGYFVSADGGLATTISLPRKWGEIYATITNGPGYNSRETDRFKDYAARLTLTPWASGPSKFMRTVALTGWAYKGAIASKFVNSTPGEVGPIGSGLDRDRWGVFAGANDPRFTFGVDYASRHEEGEKGLNTIASPRSVTDSTGRIVAGYAVVRPFGFSTPNVLEPLTVFGRFDRVTVNTDTDSKYNVVIGGIAWDLSKRASVSLDYQEVTPVEGKPITATKTYFAHFVARF